MNSQLKLSAAIAAAFVTVLGVVLSIQAVLSPEEEAVRDTAATTSDSRLASSQGRVIGKAGDGGVTFVEFLDFECEGCRAAYPAVEELRERYEGRVTFVARYFPLPGHFNAQRAARAVEAAAQQDRFEQMYQMMYTTQQQWGEKKTPQDDLFRNFARDLGLDMEKFDLDYESEATQKRIDEDLSDGAALGVQSTPSFFINGKRLEPQTFDDLTEAIDDALADAT